MTRRRYDVAIKSVSTMIEKPEMPGVGPEDIVQALLKVKALL